MEGHCSTGQSPQWAVVPMEEEELSIYIYIYIYMQPASPTKHVSGENNKRGNESETLTLKRVHVTIVAVEKQ